MSDSRKKITATTVENLRQEGFSAEECATKLGVSITDYKEILKFFGIKGKHKVGVRSRVELIDDRIAEPTTTEETVNA